MKLNEFSSGGFAAVAMPMGQMQRRIPKKKKKVDEMDKSALQPGRDGHVSHSTYGRRDRDELMTPGPFKLDIALRRHMLKKLAWETDWELSDLELLKDQELADLYHEKVADARDFYNDLKANADAVLGAKTLKRTMESIEQENQPAPEPAPQVQERTVPSLFEYVVKREQEETIKEFAPDSDGDGGEEDSLHKYARMWYQGDLETQQQVEQILDRMGWEIGEIESEEGGCFVVRSGDENGNSYIGFAPEDLTEASIEEGIDIGREWISDTELDQYVPEHLQQQWRELLGYDMNGNPSAMWANLTGGYEPDVNDRQHRALMVKVANKWFAAKKIPNVKFFSVRDADDELEWLVQIGPEGVAEEKQRLDAKCWDGYKKQGTKIKGDTRVNNCVPEAANAAQQAAIAIAKKKKKELNEAPLELNPGEPTNPRIYGTKANSAELNTRRLRALSQLKDMAKRAEDAQQYDSLLMWKSIVANFAELAMNIGEIDHAIRELEKIRRKGGANSRGIPDLS